MSRLDEQGPRSLVRIGSLVSNFPEFVAYIVRRLKVLCPSTRTAKIAQILCRAGPHIGSTTVQGRLPTDRERCLRRLRAHSILSDRQQSEPRLVRWLVQRAQTASQARHRYGRRGLVGRRPACREPRFEPRRRWPRGSPCAGPQAKIQGRCGDPIELRVRHLSRRRDRSFHRPERTIPFRPFTRPTEAAAEDCHLTRLRSGALIEAKRSAETFHALAQSMVSGVTRKATSVRACRPMALPRTPSRRR